MLQPIATIAHSKTFEDTKFCNLFDFPKGNLGLFNFTDTQAGHFGPPESPETNPCVTSIPYPRPHFNFVGNM